MYIKQLTNNEFKAFSKNFKPSSIYQTVEYAFTMNDQDFHTIFFELLIFFDIHFRGKYLDCKNTQQLDIPYLLTKLWDTLNILHNKRVKVFYFLIAPSSFNHCFISE